MPHSRGSRSSSSTRSSFHPKYTTEMYSSTSNQGPGTHNSVLYSTSTLPSYYHGVSYPTQIPTSQPPPPPPTPDTKPTKSIAETMLQALADKKAYADLSFQKECLQILLDNVNPSSEHYLPNMAGTLYWQHLSGQPYHDSNIATPIVRFDAKRSPIFQFFYRSLSAPQDDVTKWMSATVDEEIIEYSTAIYELIRVPGSGTADHLNTTSSFSGYWQPNQESSQLQQHSGPESNEEPRKRVSDVKEPQPKSRISTSKIEDYFSKRPQFESTVKKLNSHGGSEGEGGSGGSSSSTATTGRPRTLHRSPRLAPRRYRYEVEPSEVEDTDQDRESHRRGSKRRRVESSTSESSGSESEEEEPTPRRSRGRPPGGKNNTNSGQRPRPTAKCEECNLVFSRVFTYNRHVQGVHMNLKPFRCTWGRSSKRPCNYSCSQRFQTLNHIKTVHLTMCEKKRDEDPVKYLEVVEEEK